MTVQQRWLNQLCRRWDEVDGILLIWRLVAALRQAGLRHPGRAIGRTDGPTTPLTAADVSAHDEAAQRHPASLRRAVCSAHRCRYRPPTRKNPFTSTAELVALLYQAIPARPGVSAGISQANIPGAAHRGQR